MSDVLTERRGPLAWITLNRPERRNAYDAAMGEAMIAAVREAVDAAAIVITGTERAFCAGGYLKNLAKADEYELRAMFEASFRLFDEIRRSPRPVIAAVNGAAFGGGNELVVACDFALIGEEFFAATAYLSREPKLVGSLKAGDWMKVVIIVVMVVGAIALTFGLAPHFADWFVVE